MAAAGRTPGPDGPITIADYERLDEPDEWRYELVRGMVVREPAPAPRHAVTLHRLSVVLDRVTPPGAGVWLSDGGFVLEESPPTVRRPDLAFVSAARIPSNAYGSSFWRLSPDLAIEVLSPSNRRRELADKIAQYLAAGTTLVWVVDPARRCVELHGEATGRVCAGEVSLAPVLRASVSLAAIFATIS